MSPSFSTVIITRNEAKRIKAVIQSVKNVSEDIIVVDSGSKDDTVEIAQSLGARVYTPGWHGYGSNKNIGTEKACNDWIISIDGDEILSPELIETLKTLTPEENHIYQINSIVNYGGRWIRHSGWYPKWKNRIFNRNEVQWDHALVHEDLTPVKGKTIVKLKGDIHHYSYDSMEDHKSKVLEYADLKARDWIDRGNHPGWMKMHLGPVFNLVRTYIFKAGFLDGKRGWTIAKMNALMAKKEIEIYKKIIAKL